MFKFENPFGKKDEVKQELPAKPNLQAEKFSEKPACFSATIASEEHPERNEDDFFINQEEDLFGVFDGVGGKQNGAEASKIAKYLVSEFLKSNLVSGDLEQVKKSLQESLLIANNRLIEQTGGKTTASVVKIWEDPSGAKKAIIGNVGDSRVYVLRDGQLSQLTIDDNIVKQHYKNDDESARRIQKRLNNATDDQNLTNDEKLLFNSRNIIYNFLGQSNFKPNIMVFDLLPGDKILLCSDGISDNLTDLQIESLLKESGQVDPAKKLIDQALTISRQGQKRSKQDDITAIVVELSGQQGKINLSKELNSEDVEQKIEFATTIDEIFLVLKDIPGLRGSQRFYTSDELCEMIRRVKAGELPIDRLPRILGLRDKIAGFLDKNNNVFKVGSRVNIRRTNGLIESDWFIERFMGDEVGVYKIEGNTTSRKIIKISELKSLNG